MIKRTLNITKVLSGGASILLLGARGVGKTALIRKELATVPHVLEIDLLKSEIYRRLLKNPEFLRADVEFAIKKITLSNNGTKEKLLVFIDEVQRIPQILNEVHSLLEANSGRVQFVLTGSSARKLRKEGANLLAGRLRQVKLHPITYQELELPLEKCLQFGQLPTAINTPEVSYLESYVDLYLREEIYQESLVRKQEVFSRFLDVAAQYSGELISFSKLARISNTTDVTVKEYFQILVDTLLVHKIESFSYSTAKQISQKPRFYFFDIGILNAARGETSVKCNLSSKRCGKLFEHLVILELIRLNDYLNQRYKFGHYRESEKLEVDIIMYRGLHDPPIAIEIKVDESPDLSDLKGLLRFKEHHPNAQLFCFTAGLREYELNGITIYPWQTGINQVLSKNISELNSRE
jgi:uncharacterized protein